MNSTLECRASNDLDMVENIPGQTPYLGHLRSLSVIRHVAMQDTQMVGPKPIPLNNRNKRSSDATVMSEINTNPENEKRKKTEKF